VYQITITGVPKCACKFEFAFYDTEQVMLFDAERDDRHAEWMIACTV
jgi:hypothetical protein